LKINGSGGAAKARQWLGILAVMIVMVISEDGLRRRFG
jgi:hypothetical protein